MKKRRCIGVVALLVMMMSGLVACDSDVPEVPKDPQEPEAPEAPVEIEPLPEEVRPVLTDGKRWVVQWRHNLYDDDNRVIGETIDTVTFQVKGDTIVDGFSAKTIIYDKYCYGEIGASTTYREENGKVIMDWGKNMYGKSIWGVLYNVNATYEDRVITSLKDWIIPISRGVVVAKNKMRRAVKIKDPFPRKKSIPFDYWIEGVGSLYCSWYDARDVRDPIPTCVPRIAYFKILECYENGEKIFDAKKFDESCYTPLEVFGE